MKYLILLLLFLLTFELGQAQPPRLLGVLKENSNIQHTPKIPSPAKGSVLPDSISWKAFAPEVGDQGYELNSCVGWAASYLMTIAEAIYMGPNQSDPICLEELKYSASYLYNKIKINPKCTSGAYLSEALKRITQKGICRNSDFQNSTESCTGPSPQLDARLPKYFSTEYHELFRASDNISQRNKILDVKRMLASDKPVLVSLEVTNSFFETDGTVWSPKIDEKRYDLLHAVVVVGYNEKYFELLNSYGKNWRNKGFFYMTHEHFSQYVYDAYVICQDSPGECFGKGAAVQADKLYLYASIEQLQKSGQYREVALQKSVSRQFVYELVSDTLKTADWLRIKLQELPEYIYLYLANINPAGQASLLMASGPDTGLSDGNIINDLYLEKGKEQLILLLAKRPLGDIREKIKKLEDCPGQIEHKLQCVFGVTPETFDQLHFSRDKLLVIGRVKRGLHRVLPIVLNIDVKE